MKNQLTALFLLLLVASAGCKKDEVPQESYYFTFNVRMSNKINEPTIVSGFYGTMTNKNGKVKLKKNAIEENIKPVAQNKIYLYDADNIEQIRAHATESEDITLYDLRKLEKEDIKPKFIVTPNKSGFFQFDTGDKSYIPLVKVKGNKGYYPEGLKELPILSSELVKMDIVLSY